MGVCPSFALAQRAPSKAVPSRPFAAILPAEQAWMTTLPGAPSAGAAHDGARVYVPLPSTMVALDRDSGETVWTAELASSTVPLVHDGSVYVATDRAIHALNASDGVRRWTAPTDAEASLLRASPNHLLAVVGATVVALDLTTGRPLWRRAVDSATGGFGVSLGPDSVFVSSANGHVVSLALADGSITWQRQLAGRLAPPLLAHDRLYLGSTDNRFYALDVRTGKTDWNWRTGGDVIGAAADARLVYFLSLDNMIRAVNPGNGNQQWKRDAGTRPLRPPLAFDGSLLVTGLTPSLATFAPETGLPIGSYDAPGELQGDLLVSPSLKPRGVGMVAVLRDGRVLGLRSVGLMFNEAPRQSIDALPGRVLPRDRLP